MLGTRSLARPASPKDVKALRLKPEAEEVLTQLKYVEHVTCICLAAPNDLQGLLSQCQYPTAEQEIEDQVPTEILLTMTKSIFSQGWAATSL